jgi:hypothetical protein
MDLFAKFTPVTTGDGRMSICAGWEVAELIAEGTTIVGLVGSHGNYLVLRYSMLLHSLLKAGACSWVFRNRIVGNLSGI